MLPLVIAGLVAACGSAVPATKPAGAGSDPSHYSGTIPRAALARLPASRKAIGESSLVLGVFGEEAAWRRFVAAAGLDPAALQVDFRFEVVAFAIDGGQGAQLYFHSWNGHEGGGLLLVQMANVGEGVVIGGEDDVAVVLVVLELGDSLRRIRLGWFDENFSIEDGSRQSCPIGGGSEAATFVLAPPAAN